MVNVVDYQPNYFIGSDLRYAPIYKQFNTCDVTAVIGCKEGDGFCDLIGISDPTHWHTICKSLHELLELFLTHSHTPATHHWCIYPARTYSINTDLAVFQINSP